MAVSTSAGVALYIGTTATLGATDTYTKIGQVVNVPEFGRSYNDIKFITHDSGGATQHFKGSFDDGTIAIELGKDAADAGQLLIIAALADKVSDYNFKLVAPDQVLAASATVTVTIAAPGVVTDTAHGFAANTPVSFSTTGALPTGLVAGTTYYILAPATNTYTLSATAGGAPITTSGTQSGVMTRTTVPVGTQQLLKAKVMSYTTNYGQVDGVVMAKMSLGIKSGSIVETARLPAS